PFIAVVLLQTVFSGGLVAVAGYFLLFSAAYGLLAWVALRVLDERSAHLLMVPLYRVIFEPLRAYLIYSCLGTGLRGVRLGWDKLARTASVDELLPEPGAGRAPTRVHGLQPDARPVVVPA
ncbi:MAG: hypothetical protein ACLGI3_17165, partial [Actinomycetes bacterium]